MHPQTQSKQHQIKIFKVCYIYLNECYPLQPRLLQLCCTDKTDISETIYFLVDLTTHIIHIVNGSQMLCSQSPNLSALISYINFARNKTISKTVANIWYVYTR